MDFIDTAIRNKTITVMGLGLHGGGLSVAGWLLEYAATVIVTDMKTEAQLAASVEKLNAIAAQLGADDRLVYHLGGHQKEDFVAVDMVIKNPGVPTDSEFLEVARTHNVAIHNEASLFFLLCPKPIIGITGSKGKSTTTALLGAIAREVYPTAIVAGNIKTTPMFEILDTVQSDPTVPFVILELSSWQLEDMAFIGKSPHIALVTNMFPEHLNRHKTMGAYAEAKAVIQKFQTSDDIFIVNDDDEYTQRMAVTNKATQFAFSLEHPVTRGMYLEHDTLIYVDGDSQEVVLHVDDIPLLGRHNIANVAAAALTALQLDIPVESIKKTVRAYTGLSARLEYIGEYADRGWYNDTTATAPQAVVAALSAFEDKVFLIAGGSDKGSPIDDMAEAIMTQTLHVALLPGDGSAKLKRIFDDRGFLDYTMIQTMDEAVACALEHTKANDAVVLSPGFASFASFAHEFERGDIFVQCAKACDKV